uniref:RNase H type-1 domain-containing protein n=1 Tax=Chenopodium quinoa TaxID=63459 RepID=A0A803LVG9_CHEQI
MGIVLTSPLGDKIAQAVRCKFKATNNEAEYEAPITGLTVAKDMKIKNLEVISDSLLIVNQINGNVNTEADALANLGSNINPDKFGVIPLVHIMSPAIEKESAIYEIQANPIDEEDSWTKPFKDFFTNKVTPKGKVVAHAFTMKASKYFLISNVLFK